MGILKIVNFQKKHNFIDFYFLQVDDVLRMIDYKTEELDNIFKEFNVLHTEGVDPSFIKAMGHETVVILWLTGINVFQALLIILIVSLCFNQKQKYILLLPSLKLKKNKLGELGEISLCFNQKQKYKRRLKAATIGKKHACP